MPWDKKNVIEAVKESKNQTEKRNFIQSIDLIINLRDIDPKKPEGKIQELIELPYPVGKENKICVIASGEMALKAKKAGADLVLERSELEALADNKKKQKKIAETYNFFIAEAPLMPIVGRVLGSTLGPRGRMPKPLPPTSNVEDHIERHRKMILVRLRGQPVIQCSVGNESSPDEQIAENVQTILRRIEGKLKRGDKNIRSVYLKTTMGPPAKVRM